MKRTIFLLPILLIVTACAGAFEATPVNYAWGTPPSLQSMQEQIPGYFETILKDPESARYRYGTPFKGQINKGLISGGGIQWIGWVFPVQINAKNSFGGYTGYKTHYVLTTNGRIYRHIDENTWDAYESTGIVRRIY